MARSLHTAAHRELVAAAVALRKRAKLSQRALAERLGREQNYVGRIETGQRRIDLVEWVMLCQACEADPASELATVLKLIEQALPSTAGRQQRKK